MDREEAVRERRNGLARAERGHERAWGIRKRWMVKAKELGVHGTLYKEIKRLQTSERNVLRTLKALLETVRLTDVDTLKQVNERLQVNGHWLEKMLSNSHMDETQRFCIRALHGIMEDSKENTKDRIDALKQIMAAAKAMTKPDKNDEDDDEEFSDHVPKENAERRAKREARFKEIMDSMQANGYDNGDQPK
jgi:hypothetical protein